MLEYTIFHLSILRYARDSLTFELSAMILLKRTPPVCINYEMLVLVYNSVMLRGRLPAYLVYSRVDLCNLRRIGHLWLIFALYTIFYSLPLEMLDFHFILII